VLPTGGRCVRCPPRGRTVARAAPTSHSLHSPAVLRTRIVPARRRWPPSGPAPSRARSRRKRSAPAPDENRSKIRPAGRSGMPVRVRTVSPANSPVRRPATSACMTSPATVCGRPFSSAARRWPRPKPEPDRVHGDPGPPSELPAGGSADGRHRLIASDAEPVQRERLVSRSPDLRRRVTTAVPLSGVTGPARPHDLDIAALAARQLRASSSRRWPSAIVIGRRSWCAASCRNFRWDAAASVVLADRLPFPVGGTGRRRLAKPWRRTSRPSAHLFSSVRRLPCRAGWSSAMAAPVVTNNHGQDH